MTPYDAVAQENVRLRARIVELEDDLRHLQRQLSRERNQQDEIVLMRRLKLRAGEAAIVHLLYDAWPKALSSDELIEALGSSANPEMVRVYITRSRVKMGRNAIDTIWDRGYVLTDIGRTLVEQMLAPLRGAA